MDIVAILLLLHVVSESLLTRGSRDMALDHARLGDLARRDPAGRHVGGRASSRGARSSRTTRRARRSSSDCSTAPRCRSPPLAAGFVYHLLHPGELGLAAGDFPQVLGPILAANITHCAVNGVLVAVDRGPRTSGSPRWSCSRGRWPAR